MASRSLIFGAGINVLIAIMLWSGFGVLVWQLQEVRGRVVVREEERAKQETTEATASELQALMRDTRDDRLILDQVVKTDALAAAATIEAAGRKAGVTVSIEGATVSDASGASSPDLRVATVVATAEGTWPHLMNVASLFETLPFPSRVESYEFSSLDTSKTQRNPWRMSARILILIPSDSAL